MHQPTPPRTFGNPPYAPGVGWMQLLNEAVQGTAVSILFLFP
jgi:hypothetical protein